MCCVLCIVCGSLCVVCWMLFIVYGLLLVAVSCLLLLMDSCMWLSGVGWLGVFCLLFVFYVYAVRWLTACMYVVKCVLLCVVCCLMNVVGCLLLFADDRCSLRVVCCSLFAGVC